MFTRGLPYRGRQPPGPLAAHSHPLLPTDAAAVARVAPRPCSCLSLDENPSTSRRTFIHFEHTSKPHRDTCHCFECCNLYGIVCRERHFILNLNLNVTSILLILTLFQIKNFNIVYVNRFVHMFNPKFLAFNCYTCVNIFTHMVTH